MLLGILSDSHGEARRVQAAMALFDRLGVATIAHCGDVGDAHVFGEMTGRDCHFVWGNTDLAEPGLLAFLNTVGIEPPSAVPRELRRAGRLIHIYHGHEPAFRRATAAPDVDYVLHGHTHVCRDERISGIRVINPGALHRARRYTVATLDLDLDVVTFHDISGAC